MGEWAARSKKIRSKRQEVGFPHIVWRSIMEREKIARSYQRGGAAIRSKITRGKRLDEHFEKSAQNCKKQFLASCL